MKIDFHNNTLIITIYDLDNLDVIQNAIEEMTKFLCKKIKVDDSDLENYNELHIDVDDYYEYQSYKCLIYNYTTI